MFRGVLSPIAVALWAVAVAGAVVVLIAPLTPWVVPIEILGLVVSLGAAIALAVWFVRR